VSIANRSLTLLVLKTHKRHGGNYSFLVAGNGQRQERRKGYAVAAGRRSACRRGNDDEGRERSTRHRATDIAPLVMFLDAEVIPFHSVDRQTPWRKAALKISNTRHYACCASVAPALDTRCKSRSAPDDSGALRFARNPFGSAAAGVRRHSAG
jgi:hypothetical protein